MDAEQTPAVRSRTPRGQGRGRVLEAAGQLFADHGVSGTSLQDIADRLQVTKAAVYHQFATKDEIVIAVAEPVIDRLRRISDLAETMPADLARGAVIRGLVDIALTERGTAAVVRRDPTMSQILDAHRPYTEQLERVNAILLGPDPTPERRIALAFAGGGIMAVGSLPGLDGPSDQVRAGLIAAMTRALDTGS
jgi:AcrR family transcriptional regulator